MNEFSVDWVNNKTTYCSGPVSNQSKVKCECVCSARGEGERVKHGEEGRKPRKTYKDLERPVTTLGGVHPSLCSGVNRFHVCLHFIYCSTCCCRHSGYKAFLDYYCIIVRVAGEQHSGSTSLSDRCVVNPASGMSASRKENIQACRPGPWR